MTEFFWIRLEAIVFVNKEIPCFQHVPSFCSILQESGAGILDLVEHCGADIEPLEKAGVPAFSPIQDNRFYFDYHHTAADTLDKIVPKELAENSAVVAVVAYALANMERPLPR